MTTSDAAEFKRLIFRLDTVFDKPASAARVDAYFEELRDIPIGLVRDAVSLHTRKARTYPRPAELRKLADVAQGIDDDKPPRLLLPPRTPTGEPEPPVYHCTVCEDTGWAPTTMKAPIYGPEATVAAVKRCACWPTNPKKQQAKKRYGDRDADFSRSW
jgi:hypothetical protein